MINLTVNEQPVTVPEGTTILQAVRAAGVELPTLCFHEGLAPYGACRLCMVSIAAPRHALVASCAYPVEEGLAVETNSPEAVSARRLALEFLLSRCPQSEVIQEMAAQEGVTASRFGTPPPERAEELCVLCGLCVRVCREAIGAAAIGFIGRGMERRVGTPFDIQAATCIGCGACAEICPTKAIKIEDRGNKRILHTWHTTVELHKCPQCGKLFAPEPMAFLGEMFPEIEEQWALCPECRRARTAQQWVEQRFTSPA
ncbi:MAG: 2Fe-2S iron-sulfur cluster-binding protein [Anaerolineae bacterium]|jgi:NADH dehydrogenase/NADH:ubiquinone oxidoreductase subunit G|nr:2Fe-2S iron-sulfur cluster-binding protein [Anaerolineae bacterium]MDH7473352.1 2Fe-2S iron-sulfur cluster-binding protein [Anaerolineae bacterium]